VAFAAVALVAFFIGVTGALITTSLFFSAAGFGATGAALAVDAVELAAATFWVAAGLTAVFGTVAAGLAGASTGLVWVAIGLASGFLAAGASALTSGFLAGAAFLAKSCKNLSTPSSVLIFFPAT
jgi:hypothetical protein